jgi:tetratricopeptide (TPR) repeat protein
MDSPAEANSTRAIQPPVFAWDYDAFLSYNRSDFAAVAAIARALREKAQLRIFLDKWCLIPGDPWQDEIERALDRSATCVVFIGPHGVSPWGHLEMRTAIDLRIKQAMLRVIPVLLPGVEDRQVEQLPIFLRSLNWVDFRNGLDDGHAYDELRAGIGGYAPAHVAQPTGPTRAAPPPLGTMILHALPPAADFQDRPELQAVRAFWTNESPAGVLALVGIGGSGKTAVVCRFLQELPGSGVDREGVPKNAALPAPEGMFVWSFYDQPDIESFFAELYEFLTSERSDGWPARDLTSRVIRCMERSPYRRVLLVLDGLEVVQESRDSTASFGVLRDSSLRHLARRVAQGGLGFRMLITSRFPFPDLSGFQGQSYLPIDVDSLDPYSARKLLRARGVVGSDADLNALLRDFGNHALTLDHLGTLLHDFFRGNAQRARDLPALGTAGGEAYAEYQAHRLARIFSFYEERLPSTERTVLETLCVFRIPVGLSILTRMFAARNEARDSALPRIDEVALHAVLGKLHSRRLIALAPDSDDRTCCVHPSIRDYFYNKLGDRRAGVHNDVRLHLVELVERPRRTRTPTNPHDLDIFEELIYHAGRSGNLYGALSYYGVNVGGYRHLGWRLADYQRGLRIASGLVEVGGMEATSDRFTVKPWYDRGLYHLDLGRPACAERQLRELLAYCSLAQLDGPFGTEQEVELKALSGNPSRTEAENHRYYQLAERQHWRFREAEEQWLAYEGMVLQSLCDTLISQGKLAEAESLADLVVNKFVGDKWKEIHFKLIIHSGSNPFGRRASARFLRGAVPEALADCRSAYALAQYIPRRFLPTDLSRASCGGWHTALHASFLLRLGKLQAAVRVLRKCDVGKARQSAPLLAAQFELAYGEFHQLRGEVDHAADAIESALAWAIQSGHQETLVRANLSRARLLRMRGETAEARSAIREAEELARSCGFTIWLVDTLVVSGHLALIAGDHDLATRAAREAFDLAAAAQCGYRWGMGNARHLQAEVEVRRGKPDRSLPLVREAVAIREALQDPRCINSQRLLSQLAPS